MFKMDNPRFDPEKFWQAAVQGPGAPPNTTYTNRIGFPEPFGHAGSGGNVEEVAPPGREDQVLALKKKFGAKSASPFKIAWAIRS